MEFLIALLVLSVLIFVHELGHFIAAKFFGVQVDVFSIGFGKKLYSRRFGQTEWQIATIPLGGYVKMKGQDDANPTATSKEGDAYSTKAPWQRIMILLAGPMANFLMAFVLYLAIAQIGIPKALPVIGVVAEETPALRVGLRAGDQIISIDGLRIDYWDEVSTAINDSHKTDIPIVVLRDGMQQTFIITPEIKEGKNIFGETVNRRLIGIGPSGASTALQLGPIETLNYAMQSTWDATSLIFQSVQKLITGAVSTDQLGGIITIVDVTAKASNAGVVALLFFTALISVNLGVLNLLPIPALDGGHILFNLYEMIRGRGPSEAVLYRLTVGGWAILFGLMFLGLYNDINRLMIGG
jgi:regulator of sigma E protease